MGKTRFLFFFLFGNTNGVTTFALPAVNPALHSGRNNANTKLSCQNPK